MIPNYDLIVINTETFLPEYSPDEDWQFKPEIAEFFKTMRGHVVTAGAHNGGMALAKPFYGEHILMFTDEADRLEFKLRFSESCSTQ